MKFKISLLAASLLSVWLLAPSARAQSSAPAGQIDNSTAKITITTSNNPPTAGTSSGGGSKTVGQSVTLTATAKTGAVFVDWTTNGVAATNKSTYKFTAGSNNETVVANFDWVVTTGSSPAVGGTNTGAGQYTNGQTVFLTATPAANGCYYFVNWTKKGSSAVFSADQDTSFVITNGESLQANFQLKEDVITTASNPVGGGTTSGKGTYGCGSSVTVTASAAAGYRFVNWTVDGDVRSTLARYTFTAEGAEALTANFVDDSVPTLVMTTPTGVEKVGASLLWISGTANNVLGVSDVVVMVNGEPVSATTANNWANWTVGVLLPPGSNLISAYALSEMGTPSRTNMATVINTNAGLAPVSLAGLIGRSTNNEDGTDVISFGEATLEHFGLEPGQGAGVGNYAYIQTSPDTATLISADFEPPDQADKGYSTNYLTFTSPTTANATNADPTKFGTITFTPGQTLDVSSQAGFSYTAVNTLANTSVTVFGNATFTRTMEGSPEVEGSYTSMQYGPMAAMIVLTNTQPDVSGVETNFSLLLFSSRTNGAYYSTQYDAAGDPPSYDSGTFTAVYHSTGEDYVALATLNGVSGTVSPSRGSSFGISFGQATFAKTTTSTNHPDQESGVYDYVYARTGPKTAVLFQYSLLSPSDIPNIIGLDFASSGSANWTNYTLSVAGSISFSTVPQSGYFAPAALTDVTAKSTSGGESETNLLFYGSFTSGGGSSYGTYTYAPFSPTVGMLVQTYTDPDDAGGLEYIQLNFNSPASGKFYATKPSDNSVMTGTFTATFK